jgi:hypothetical protein
MSAAQAVERVRMNVSKDGTGCHARLQAQVGEPAPEFISWQTNMAASASVQRRAPGIGSLVAAPVTYVGAAFIADSIVPFSCASCPVPGFFTNGVFALYTIWLPELFSASQRAFGSGSAVPACLASTAVIYIMGLSFMAPAPETATGRCRSEWGGEIENRTDGRSPGRDRP